MPSMITDSTGHLQTILPVRDINFKAYATNNLDT